MQISVLTAIDNVQREGLEYLKPHYGIHSYEKLGKLNNNARLPDVDVGVFAAFLEEEEDMLGMIDYVE